MGLELLQQVRELIGVSADASPADAPVDAIIVPVGGGGMISGVAMAVKSLYPSIRVIGAEPAGAADAAASLAAGHIVHHASPPVTVADGLRTVLGSHNWPIIRDMVERIITVDDDAILGGMRLVWERMKCVVEPSAGVGPAVLLSREFAELEGINTVAVILCGGNVDLSGPLPWARE
jgi:threonine dehydratase